MVERIIITQMCAKTFRWQQAKIPDASTQAKVQKFLGRAVEEEEA